MINELKQLSTEPRVPIHAFDINVERTVLGGLAEHLNASHRGRRHTSDFTKVARDSFGFGVPVLPNPNAIAEGDCNVVRHGFDARVVRLTRGFSRGALPVPEAPSAASTW
jgi:hypothetical protein